MAYASTAQFIAGVRNPGVDFGADVRVEIHSRIVHPLADVTLLFLGLPLVLSQEPQCVPGDRAVPVGRDRVFVLAMITLAGFLAKRLFISPH